MKGPFLKISISLLLLILVIQGSIYLSGSFDMPNTVTRSDAIILLSGNHKERAPAAALLMRNGYADRIILTNDGVFSSWSTKYNRNLYQMEWAEEELVSLGVKREQIIKLPELVNSTMSEAVLAGRYVRENGLKKIILVTADYHTRRAVWAFRKAFENDPVEIMSYPALSKATGIGTDCVEFGKLMYYRIKYGMLGILPKNKRP
jgi:uncharacterized SAM-binding protein YcdF (DUF218 family)